MKLSSKFLKGLFLSVLAVIITAMSQNPVVWGVVILGCLSTALTYVGKNLWIPELSSNTQSLRLDLTNLISGLCLALANAITTGLGTLIIDGKVDWLLVGKLAVSVLGGYLTATFVEGKKETA